MNANVNTELLKKQMDEMPAESEFIGFYQINNEVQISVRHKGAVDYASMRAAQLNALLHLTYGAGGDEFRKWSNEIQDNVMWLASTLADEIEHLIPIIREDTIQWEKGRAK